MGDMSLRRAGPTLSGPADLFFKTDNRNKIYLSHITA